MEQATNDLAFNCSKIIFLPFIHAPPTNYDTVLTCLLDATKQTADHFQKTCFVTFDQPLYMKARDIVESCQYPDLSRVVVRLSSPNVIYGGHWGNNGRERIEGVADDNIC